MPGGRDAKLARRAVPAGMPPAPTPTSSRAATRAAPLRGFATTCAWLAGARPGRASLARGTICRVIAIANDGIRAHAAELVGRPVTRDDLALAFSESTARSAEVLVEGRSFYPRMLEDIAS